jgi:hypothetical protein
MGQRWTASSGPANDNAQALTNYLQSEEARAADPPTLLAIARLAKCGAVHLTTEQLRAVQRVIENA